MSARMLAAALVAGLGLALAPTSASAGHRSNTDLDFRIWLDQGFFAFGYNTDYGWRDYRYRPVSRFYGGRHIRTETVITRGGLIKVLYLRRGRVVDSEIIGRINRRGFRQGRYAYRERYYFGHPPRRRFGDRYARRWERYDNRYDRRRDRYDERYDRRRNRFDDRRDRRDRRFDDRDFRDDRRRREPYREDTSTNGYRGQANPYGIEARVVGARDERRRPIERSGRLDDRLEGGNNP